MNDGQAVCATDKLYNLEESMGYRFKLGAVINYMKKILITGATSYIGTNFKKCLEMWPDEYRVDSISLRNNEWRNMDFEEYDVLFHVAAIVHRKEKPEMESLYLKVNKDLAVEVAKKAQEAGVRQFIFMSTMAVYGDGGKIGKAVMITTDTKPNPKTYYSKSKIEAEHEINKLANPKFKVVILRPPMVYGPNCPGNYARLEKLALRSPVFPMVKNKRSMIHIDKLCQYVKEYIDDEVEGIFLPQDDEYVCTSEMVKMIAEVHGKKIVMTKLFNPLLRLLKVGLVDKVFGDLVYDKNLILYEVYTAATLEEDSKNKVTEG